MRILLLSSAYNGLCQRAHIELEALGHDVSITLAISPSHIKKSVLFFQPDLIICPFLKEKIPQDVWSQHICLIVHPGIKGDRGPSSLDWAIMNQETEWGVTILQADLEMDAGPIWATETFPMRPTAKASLYRREVTKAAIKAILLAVKRVESKQYCPESLDYSKRNVKGRLRPLMQQNERKIAWESDSVGTILQKINAADSFPGVVDLIGDQEYYLYGAHEERHIKSWKLLMQGGAPGKIIAKRNGAILRMATDGAVWISHLKPKSIIKLPFYKQLFSKHRQFDFKLPAARVLSDLVADVPELAIHPLFRDAEKTFKEIWYEENNAVGYLYFDFHNGAMNTDQCHRLTESYRLALTRPTKVLVLMGGKDFWSNGIHLNAIEAATDPAMESWRNINAINDFVLAVLTTESKLTISAVGGNCGAGGAMAILAADKVWARDGVVFNPHYKTMGLYGSEYWTYSLPKRVGPAKALELTETTLPIGTKKAKAIGFIDEIFPENHSDYLAQIISSAEALAAHPQYAQMLSEKRHKRLQDEQIKPLWEYRAVELQKMSMNFSGIALEGKVNFDIARYNFVHKIRPTETGACLAKHMRHDPVKLKEMRLALAY